MSTEPRAAIRPSDLPLNGGRGDRFPSGRAIDWPLCDLCQTVMEQVMSEPDVSRFRCEKDGFELSFKSCRYSDRYCAWRMANV